MDLTPAQVEARAAFRAFADVHVAPFANRFDREECFPRELVARIAAQGYLAAMVPAALGGKPLDAITYGLLNEAMGRACSSARSLLTVHSMVCHAIARWGSKAQRERFLPALATGERTAAFALSEPLVGSDASAVTTTMTRVENGSIRIDGIKKWTTFGQTADLLLVFGRTDDKPAAVLVPRDAPGLIVRPIAGMIGCRASMLAELEFRDCRVGAGNALGGSSFAGAQIAQTALDNGRYTVAWGCVGILQACLDATLRYTSQRRQFGVPIAEHQLVQRIVTEMVTKTRAARLMCLHAGRLRDSGDPASIMETSMAKYYASTSATAVASDAVQLHGANGCSGDFPVQRYMRDAKVMEIIEGSTQIHQEGIAKYAYETLDDGAGRP
jgi:alkylation response protein AidB-like acyl-CoA dehydrogenase